MLKKYGGIRAAMDRLHNTRWVGGAAGHYGGGRTRWLGSNKNPLHILQQMTFDNRAVIVMKRSQPAVFTCFRSMSNYEKLETLDEIRSQVQGAWRTDEIRRRKPSPQARGFCVVKGRAALLNIRWIASAFHLCSMLTVCSSMVVVFIRFPDLPAACSLRPPQDESREGLTYFHETIYSGLPVFLRRIDTALKNIGQPMLPLDAKLFSFGGRLPPFCVPLLLLLWALQCLGNVAA